MSTDRRLLELAGVIHRNIRLLNEEEGDDEGGDVFGDDAGGDEEGDDAADEEGDEAEGDEEEEEEEEEEPEAVAVSAEDEALLGPSEIDRELDSVFQTAFDDAMKSAVVNASTPSYPGEQEEKVEEILRSRSLLGLLKEEADEAEGELPPDPKDFDMEHYCSETARYIKNYQNILDMEGMIFNKARQFLMNKFGQAAADELEELLALKHGIDLKEKYEEDTPDMYATGAAGEGGGGV